MAGMAAQQLTLGEDALRRISPDLVSGQPRFVKRVTAFFTDGKDHPGWMSGGITAEETATRGATARVMNAGGDMELRGTVMVDVAACSMPSRVASSSSLGARTLTPSWGRGGTTTLAENRKSFREARRATMTTLVHELAHVRRSWTLGLLPGTRRNLQDELYRVAIGGKGYGNDFEAEAFAYSLDWIAAQGAKVDSGAFDDLLPLQMIRRYAPA